MDVDPYSSSSSGGVSSFLWGPDRFLFYLLGGYGYKLTSGIIGDYENSSTTMVSGGINVTMSSIMGIGEGVSMLLHPQPLLGGEDMTNLYKLGKFKHHEHNIKIALK